MRRHRPGPIAAIAACITLTGCGGGGGGGGGGSGPPPTSTHAATPVLTSTPGQNGAVVVALSSSSSGATIHYSVDGSTPTSASPTYQAPLLVASNETVKAIAQANGLLDSAVMSQDFAPNIGSGVLVWSDEFTNSGSSPAQPNPSVWTYDTGNSGFGNQELENYCAWGATAYPCDVNKPNAFVGTDGYLHIVARQPAPGVYTSARMISQGLFSFQYGRFEFRAKVPEAQGYWPAIWLLGNNINTVGFPGCGEMDVLERIDGVGSPDWNEGSIHGQGFIDSNLGTTYNFPSGQTAADWHVYGMVWKPGSVSYYIDDPSHPYVTYTPSSLSGLAGSVWPFENGPNFILINLAVGGTWPGPPNGSTPFPSEMLVDYVRVYTN